MTRSIADFINSRLSIEEAYAEEIGNVFHLSIYKALRSLVKSHEDWPVLLESEPTFEQSGTYHDNSIIFRASKQLAWVTQREYIDRFGTEPPTTPMLKAVAAIWDDHPDYDKDWSIDE